MKVEAPWAKIPLHVLTDEALTLGDVRVYCALDFLAGKRGHWYGPLEEIAAHAGVSKPTVARAIDTLRKRDYISTVKMGLQHRNVLRYHVHARTVDPVITEDNAPLSPTITTDVIADDHGNTTDLPQTQTTDQQQQPREDDHRRAYRAWENQAPNSLLPPLRQRLDEALDDGVPVEWIEKACISAAENGGYKNWNYIEKTLLRYKREGIESGRRMNGRAENVGPDAGRGLPEFDFEAADRLREEREARMAAKAKGTVGDVHQAADTAGGEGPKAAHGQAGVVPRTGVRE